MKKAEKIKTFLRVRPLNDDELKMANEITYNIKDDHIIVEQEDETKKFDFDYCFKQNSNQDSVFEITTKKTVESVLQGYNGTIFCYGQTGSGKTFTMVGIIDCPKNQGIIMRSLKHLFNLREKIVKGELDLETLTPKKSTSVGIVKGNSLISMNQMNKSSEMIKVSVAFVQIYLENLQDLLDPNNDKIKLREDINKQVYLDNCTWKEISSVEDGKSIFIEGEKNRITAKTLMNAQSSRSHAIYILKIESNINGIKKTSTLFLVDLAGSERVNKTGADNQRLEEAKKINFSLLALGNCIQALSNNEGGGTSYVGFRDSKLTRLLQDSLGGNCKTSLIVTISPAEYNFDESVSAMLFGQRAMKITNKPTQNMIVEYKEMYHKLLDEFNEFKEKQICAKCENKLSTIVGTNLKNNDMNLDLNKSKSFKQSIRMSVEGKKQNSEELEAFFNELITQKEEEIIELKKQVSTLEDTIFSNKNSNIEKNNILSEIAKNSKENGTNTDNNSYKEETRIILDDLYNTSNKTWGLKHFEEALKCLNEDNLNLINEVKDLKNDISSKNFECLRLKEINNSNTTKIESLNNTLNEKIKEYEIVIEGYKTEINELKDELESFNENGVNYKKLSFQLKAMFNQCDDVIKNQVIQEKSLSDFISNLDLLSKNVYKSLGGSSSDINLGLNTLRNSFQKSLSSTHKESTDFNNLCKEIRNFINKDEVKRLISNPEEVLKLKQNLINENKNKISNVNIVSSNDSKSKNIEVFKFYNYPDMEKAILNDSINNKLINPLDNNLKEYFSTSKINSKKNIEIIQLILNIILIQNDYLEKLRQEDKELAESYKKSLVENKVKNNLIESLVKVNYMQEIYLKKFLEIVNPKNENQQINTNIVIKNVLTNISRLSNLLLKEELSTEVDNYVLFTNNIQLKIAKSVDSYLDSVNKIYEVLKNHFDTVKSDLEQSSEQLLYYVREIDLLKSNFGNELTKRSENSGNNNVNFQSLANNNVNYSHIKEDSIIELKDEEIEKLKSTIKNMEKKINHYKSISIISKGISDDKENSINESDKSNPNEENEVVDEKDDKNIEKLVNFTKNFIKASVEQNKFHLGELEVVKAKDKDKNKNKKEVNSSNLNNTSNNINSNCNSSSNNKLFNDSLSDQLKLFNMKYTQKQIVTNPESLTHTSFKNDSFIDRKINKNKDKEDESNISKIASKSPNIFNRSRLNDNTMNNKMKNKPKNNQ